MFHVYNTYVLLEKYFEDCHDWSKYLKQEQV